MAGFLENYEGNKERTDRWLRTFPNGRLEAHIIEFNAEKGYVLVQAKAWRNQEETEPAGIDYAFGYREAFNSNMKRWFCEDTTTSALMRDGWEPVKAVDHPELMITGSAATGNVEIGGLMLCKMLAERARSRDDYYDQQAQNQMESVDNHFMRNNDSRMPLFADRKSSTSRGAGFGSGSK